MPRGVYERQGTPHVTTANKATVAKAKIGTANAAVNRTTPVNENQNRSTSGIQYVCLKPMKVEGVKIFPGTIVPEANSWRNVHNYVSAGYLAATTV